MNLKIYYRNAQRTQTSRRKKSKVEDLSLEIIESKKQKKKHEEK